MDLSLSDEQEILRDVLTRYLASDYPFDERRRRVIAGGPDAKLWGELAERLGILGATIPEDAGGLGGGPVENLIIMEALGQALVIEPYLETVVIGGGLLRDAGGEEAAPILEDIAAGATRIAFAHGERQAGYTLHDIAATAVRAGDGWAIDGEKTVVTGAPDADHLIVLARTSGDRRDRDGLSLFLVPADAAGISRHDFHLVDERPASDITFSGTPAKLLGEEGKALSIVEKVMDEATAALCSEAVGLMRRMTDDTVDYTKQRKQFEQPLSSFQVLQHRMVDMLIATEEAAAAALLATLKLDAEPAERARAVSAAKATIARTVRFVGQNAVQLHGGMGLTEELAVGHFFKRATVIERQFGGIDESVRRYAEASKAA